MSRPRLIALLLALVTLVVYLPVVRHGFVDYDDNLYVAGNRVVQHGLTWEGVRWAFTTFHTGNWHPVTWLSHMADCEFFQLNAGAHHFVNVLFHSANAALLFLLLWRLTQKLWPAALVAALFAWHPLHVESVAWVAERKDVLSTFFALLALLSYTRYVQAKSRRSFWFALVFFALGLMAKPMLVTLPCVMLLLDFWPLQRMTGDSQPLKKIGRLAAEKTPFFVLTVGVCIVTFLAQKHGESVVSLANTSLGYRLENAPVAAASYLEHFFWPAGLCVIYPLPDKIPALRVVGAISVLLLISIVAWRWRQTRPYFGMGWLWFLGTLVPVIGLVQVGSQAMADRYTYIPSIGIFIALVFLGNEWAARIQTPKIICLGIAGLISLACIRVTEYQLQFWRNSETLFRRAIAVTQNNDIARVNLGVTLDAQGRFAEALEVYQQAEKSGSRRGEVYNNQGNVLGLLGRHDESLAEYQTALRLRPDDARLHAAAGRELAALRQFDAALKELSEAEKLNPNDAPTHVAAAKVLFKIGRDAEGLDEFRTALRLKPDDFQTCATVAHYLAANENAAARNGPDALALALKANELSGRVQPMVFDVIGMAFAENGDFTNAVLCARHALDLATAAQMHTTRLLQTRLERYENRQPWRESFRATNAPAKD
jgi:tetratricopeptide (TPR) repeat protein